MAVKIARRIEPTSEQLAASVVLTGASALRMMRAERRQMGYISWRDLDPDEERRVLHTSSPSAEDIYLPDLVRIGVVSGEVQEDLCLLVGSAKQRRRMPCKLVRLFYRPAGRFDFGGGAGGVQLVSRGPLCRRCARSRLYPGICPGPGAVLQDFAERSRAVSALPTKLFRIV